MGLFVHRDGVIVYANPLFVRMLGYTDADELVGRDIAELVHPEDRPRSRERLATLRGGGTLAPEALRMRRCDGGYIVVEGSGVVAEFDGEPARVVVVHDVTERERHAIARASAECELRRSLAEKETLLNEVHHRVKNNLQVIASLIALQAARVQDPQARVAFAEMRGRVRTIASIHERVYRVRAFDRIDAGEYLHGLVAEVERSLRTPGREIVVAVDAEALALALDAMVPLALFVNEAVTNAFKHAFVGRAKGRVVVTLRRVDSDVELSIVDDGVGLVQELDACEVPSLGLSLIRGLVRQLDGSLVYESNAGTRCTVRFPHRDLERGVPS